MTVKSTWGNQSLFVLILANLLPVAGVLLWGWNVFEIVVLYWFENVVIGAINVLKMVTCHPDTKVMTRRTSDGTRKVLKEIPEYIKQERSVQNVHHVSKLFLVPFFTFHYGMFCFVHGVFVFTLLGGNQPGLTARGPFGGMATMLGELLSSGALIFVLAIIGSHLFSFFANYIGKGEYRKVSAPQLMAVPYGRIIVLHIAILFGAFAVMALGNSIFLLLLLIIGKIVIDSKMHLRSHRKLEAKALDD